MTAEALLLLQKEGLDPNTINLIARRRGEVVPPENPTEKFLKAFLTNHPAMIKVKEIIKKLAPLDDCVLIHGETGTGKELLANALHGTRQGLFVDINCASMPANLLESELFGHVAGAFTGAIKEKAGLLK